MLVTHCLRNVGPVVTFPATPLQQIISETRLTLAAARVEILSRIEQKIYGYDLLALPAYCSRLSRKQRLWQKNGGTE